MNNSMVAHLWANEKQESANGSNFYFEGESIYSYGRHFEVGRIVRNKRGEKAYLINDTYYSSTTSKHQYYVREAIPTGSKVFYVECNISYCIGNMLFVTNMLECIKDAIEKYKKARRMWQMVSLLHRGGPFRHGLVEDVTGHQWSINRYENDILTAGCHRIAYSEMEGIAKQLGWV